MPKLFAHVLRMIAQQFLRIANFVNPPPPPPLPPPPHLKSIKEVSHESWTLAQGDKTLRLDYPLHTNHVVIDVGGFEGQWASDIFSRYLCKVYVFEPVPEYADSIERRFACNPHIHLVRNALGAQDGELELIVDGDASSTLVGDGTKIKIPVKSFAKWIESVGINELALVKVNIEGGEYELLEHIIDTGLIACIVNLQVQFHDFVPNAKERMDAILMNLAHTHRPTYQYPFIWENWTRLEKVK